MHAPVLHRLNLFIGGSLAYLNYTEYIAVCLHISVWVKII